MRGMTTRGERQAAAAAEQGLRSAAWRALGTGVQLVVTDHLDEARAAVEQVLADVDLAASRFREDSEISRLPIGEWATVSPLLARLLTIARDAAEWTGGLVDPTVGTSLRDLGYDRTYTAIVQGTPLTVVRRPVGWRALEIDGDRVRAPEGLDLGATAKGVAADLCAAAAGAVSTAALVGLGGDIATAGDRSWPVLVRDTSDFDEVDDDGQVVDLTGALATSGTRARQWNRGGRLVHHLLDPRTGLPTQGPWRTISVVAATCALANTASTAAIVAGEPAERWLRERGFSARLVHDDGTITTVGDWPAEETL
ncbi:MAG: thiamine biosynthesis protein [Frankiales bacterium]|nr:thiamine biosynthesis protein [Frankiales bacterium]MCW2708840.1 thiamine biosynthesis protein [Frankiales bacterium]